MKQLKKMPRLDININDVIEIYSGPVGILWEMLMGEQIHVGGEKETKILAKKAQIKQHHHILDVCSALGGPARYLAKHYQCTVAGLDATKLMIEKAIERTKNKPYADLITYKLGNAIEMPFRSETFDIVWGQDAWCYVTDKAKLIKEAERVLVPSGKIVFTDWIQTAEMTNSLWTDLNEFMGFPYMETLDGYIELLTIPGFTIISQELESKNFAEYCHMYQNTLRSVIKDDIIATYGAEMFEAADQGLDLWVKAADQGKVGRGKIIAKKQNQ